MAFNRDNRSGGGRDFGRRSFGGNFSTDRQMFKAICSKCGKECEVPFKPTGSKPVYCRDCFRDMRGLDSGRSDDRFSRKPSFDNRDRGSLYPQYKEQFEALNAKLDNILKLLSPEKPIQTPKVAIVPQVKSEAIKADIKPVKNEASRSLAAISQSGIPPKPTPLRQGYEGVPLAPSSSKQASRYSAKGKKAKTIKLAPSEIPTE